jgi:hypothetical protein
MKPKIIKISRAHDVRRIGCYLFFNGPSKTIFRKGFLSDGFAKIRPDWKSYRISTIHARNGFIRYASFFKSQCWNLNERAYKLK